MILADSNIVIYTRQKGCDRLRAALSTEEVAVCSVVMIEVLGWGAMEDYDEKAFRNFFAQSVNFQLDEGIIEQTIRVRRLVSSRISLGDAIIAATAIEKDLVLWTANIDDFEEVPGLKLQQYNPDKDELLQ